MMRVLLKNRQFILFVLTGGFAASVNFGSRFLFNRWTTYGAAIVLAYLFGMITAFLLNRRLVFKQTSNALHHQIFWFCVMNLIAMVQTLVFSLLLARWIFPRIGFTWDPQAVAHAFGVMFPVITSYIGHKHLTFRKD